MLSFIAIDWIVGVPLLVNNGTSIRAGTHLYDFFHGQFKFKLILASSVASKHNKSLVNNPCPKQQGPLTL